jgi:hypothetical protein
MNQSDPEMEFIRKQLQAALPPLHEADLRADLWPEMLRRLEDAPPRFGWFDAVLAGLIVLALAVFPQLIPVVLYHL